MTRDARLSALHRGGLGLGAALPSPSAPAVLQRRAVAFRTRAASSSQPGRSAWRAGSRASRGKRVQAARRRTPLPPPPSGCLRTTPLNERGCPSSSIASLCSQEINTICRRFLEGRGLALGELASPADGRPLVAAAAAGMNLCASAAFEVDEAYASSEREPPCGRRRHHRPQAPDLL